MGNGTRCACTQLGYSLPNGAGLSSVDAGNKEIVPFPGERGEEEGLLPFDSTVRMDGDERHMGYLL